MFAAAHLRGATRAQVLTVPTEAVIKTGTRSVVIVADDATHFRPALVRVGTSRAAAPRCSKAYRWGKAWSHRGSS